MHDEDYLVELRIFEGFFDLDVGIADIHCCIAEAALDQAFDHIKHNACCRIVDAKDRSAKGSGKTIDIGFEPVLPHADPIEEDPLLLVMLFPVEWADLLFHTGLDVCICAIEEDAAKVVVADHKAAEVDEEQPKREKGYKGSDKNADDKQ